MTTAMIFLLTTIQHVKPVSISSGEDTDLSTLLVGSVRVPIVGHVIGRKKTIPGNAVTALWVTQVREIIAEGGVIMGDDVLPVQNLMKS